MQCVGVTGSIFALPSVNEPTVTDSAEAVAVWGFQLQMSLYSAVSCEHIFEEQRKSAFCLQES